MIFIQLTVKQHLLTCGKFSRGKRQPHCRNFFLSYDCYTFCTSNNRGLDKAWLQTLLSQSSLLDVNLEKKLLWMKVCLQYSMLVKIQCFWQFISYIGDNCKTFTVDVMTMLMPYFLFPKEYRYMHWCMILHLLIHQYMMLMQQTM